MGIRRSENGLRFFFGNHPLDMNSESAGKFHKSVQQPSRFGRWVWLGLCGILLGLVSMSVSVWLIDESTPAPPFSSGILLSGAETEEDPDRFGDFRRQFDTWPLPELEGKAEILEGHVIEIRRNELLFGLSLSRLETLTEGILKSGRLPRPGQREALAGPQITSPFESGDTQDEPQPSQFQFAGIDYEIVGHLDASAILLGNSIVIPESDWAELPGPEDAPPSAVFLLPRFGTPVMKLADLVKGHFVEDPSFHGRGDMVERPIRPFRFILMMLGGAGVLFGGTAVFIGISRWANQAERRRTIFWVTVTDNFALVGRQWKLYALTCVAAYGLFLTGQGVNYVFPNLYIELLQRVGGWFGLRFDVTGDPFEEGKPMHFIAQAYRDGFHQAMFTTFIWNLLRPAFGWITLPSIFLPGSGFALGLMMNFHTGFVLSLSTPHQCLKAVPHSLTVLLELQAYILAMVCSIRLLQALLLPHTLDGQGRFATWYRAVRETFSMYTLIAFVLLVSAAYEAFELIYVVPWLASL